MQGPPPPMASPFTSPPIKKQRASGTPLQPPMMMMNMNMNMMHQQQQPPPHQQQQPPPPQQRQPPPQQQQGGSAAVSQKRAQLLKLAQTNQRNNQHQLPASELVHQARMSLGQVPPIAAAAATSSSYASAAAAAAAAGPPLMNGTNGSRIPPPNGGAVVNGGGNYGGGGHTNGTASSTLMSRPPGSALRGGGRPTASPPVAATPPSPPVAFMNPNQPHLPSPVSPRATAAAAVVVGAGTTTTTAIQTPELIDARLARRLGSEFADQSNSSNIPTPSRSKSAPPSRKAPPPPPPPKPRAQEEPVKSVSFLSPEDTSTTARPQTQLETPELTKGSGGGGGGGPPTTPAPSHYRMHAGSTPAPPRHHAGSTPFPRSDLATPTPQDKQDMLRSLQDMADTPRSTVSTPESTTATNSTTAMDISPELRLQQHLAITAKEKAEAFKKVAQLEGQIAKDKSSGVTFRSPLLGPKLAAKRYVKSPLPKRLAGRLSANGGQPAPPADDPAVLKAAAASVPFEFTRDNRTFTVRRPYGLAAAEQDLWCKVGNLPAKVYERKANIDDETTLEVAATCDDGSILNLYSEYQVRHHTVDEGPHEYDNQSLTTMLGSIAYVDNHGVDQQYSLDDIWGTAMEVRGLYRTSLRAAVDALLMSSSPSSSSSVPPDHNNGSAPVPKKSTVDAGMTTDPLPKPKNVPPPPPAMEDEPDAVAMAFRYCFMWIFSWIFLAIKTFYQCIIVTIYVAIAFVVLSILYLHVKDDYGADEMGAIVKVYKSGGGIV